jgi:hypothetical protein
VSTRVMAAQQALVTALAKLASMTGDRLRLDQATVVDPVANALPRPSSPLWPPASCAPVGPRRCHTRLSRGSYGG